MTVEEMKDALDRLGIEVISVSGDEIKGHCPAHLERKGKADANPSWSINADTGVHNCFSCLFRGNLYTLVEYVNGVDLATATAWVNSGERNLTKAFERLTRPPMPQEHAIPVTNSMLSAFVAPPAEALKARGISATAAAFYGIVWNPEHKSWILPLRDPISNKLVGWQEKWTQERRFNNFPPKVNKSHCLFGYEQYSSEDMIVVESPLDVARLASIGILGGVATCGSAVSIAQINLIRSAKRVVIAMDNDSAGIKSSSEIFELSRKMGFECWFFNYDGTDQKDIGGMSKQEILYGLEHARHSIHGKKAFL